MALTTSYRAAGNQAANEQFYLDVRPGGQPAVFTQKLMQTPFLTAIEVDSQSIECR